MLDKVAIIILNWNSSAVTIDCLKSIAKVDYEEYQVFLIDNGSLDNSVETIKSEINSLKINYIQLKFNYGFTGGNNIGIEIAIKQYDPDYFLLLNNDTIIEKNIINQLVKPFKNESHIGIVVPKIFFYGDRSKYIYFAGGYINLISGLGEHYNWMKLDNPSTEIPKMVSFANGCSMLIKKEVIESVGFLDDNFFANIEDVDYSYRVTQAKFKIFYNPQAILWHREGFASKKNIGQWFRIYLTTRNVILFQRKRRMNIGLLGFAFYFSFRWVIYMSLKMILKGDYKSLRAIFSGIKDGFTKELRFVSRPSSIIYK